jgi:hypothetical protein
MSGRRASAPCPAGSGWTGSDPLGAGPRAISSLQRVQRNAPWLAGLYLGVTVTSGGVA